MRALLLAALLPLVKPKIMCSLHLTTNVDGEEVVYKLDYEDTEEGLQHAARQFVEVAKPMLDGCDSTACIIDVIAEHARAEAACDHDDPADRAAAADARARADAVADAQARARRAEEEARAAAAAPSAAQIQAEADARVRADEAARARAAEAARARADEAARARAEAEARARAEADARARLEAEAAARARADAQARLEAEKAAAARAEAADVRARAQAEAKEAARARAEAEAAAQAEAEERAEAEARAEAARAEARALAEAEAQAETEAQAEAEAQAETAPPETPAETRLLGAYALAFLAYCVLGAWRAAAAAVAGGGSAPRSLRPLGLSSAARRALAAACGAAAVLRAVRDGLFAPRLAAALAAARGGSAAAPRAAAVAQALLGAAQLATSVAGRAPHHGLELGLAALLAASPAAAAAPPLLQLWVALAPAAGGVSAGSAGLFFQLGAAPLAFAAAGESLAGLYAAPDAATRWRRFATPAALDAGARAAAAAMPFLVLACRPAAGALAAAAALGARVLFGAGDVALAGLGAAACLLLPAPRDAPPARPEAPAPAPSKASKRSHGLSLEDARAATAKDHVKKLASKWDPAAAPAAAPARPAPAAAPGVALDASRPLAAVAAAVLVTAYARSVASSPFPAAASTERALRGVGLWQDWAAPPPDDDDPCARALVFEAADGRFADAAAWVAGGGTSEGDLVAVALGAPRGFWRGRPDTLDRALCDAALFNGTADDLELEYRLSGEIDDAAPFAFDLPPTAGAVADADAALSAACDARGFDHGACDRIRGPILDDLRGLLGPKAVHDVRLCARDGAFAFARVRSLDCRGEAPSEEAVLELAEAVPF